MNIPCPKCNKPHQLCWYNGKRKNRLGVFCDKEGIIVHHRGDTQFREHVSFVEIDTEDDRLEGLDITKLPVFLTPAARKIAALKGQGQLLMMNVKPGEQVERNVNLPKVSQEEACLIERINIAIRQRDKTEREIVRLETRKREFNNAIQSLGAELSVLQTKPLKLEDK